MRHRCGPAAALALLMFSPPAPAAAQTAGTQPSPRLLEAVRLHAGIGVPRDQPRAFGIAEQLGAEGDGMAASLAGDCHFKGEGRTQDYTQSRRWYERAIALGWVEANCALGNQHFDGNGVMQDSARGLRLCRIAAEAGSANAQADIGQRYLRGRGLPQSFADALPWLTRAAEAGQANAADDLGEMYARGDGVARDPDAAMRWWALAVRRGKMLAAYNLAVLSTNRLREPFPDEAARLRSQAIAAYWSGLAMRVEPDGQRRVQAALLHAQVFNGLPDETRTQITDALSQVPRSLYADPSR